MDDDIEEIVDSEPSAANYAKRGKRVSWTGESIEGATALNVSNEKPEARMKSPPVSIAIHLKIPFQ